MKKFINIFLFYNLAVVCLLIVAGFSGKDLIKDIFFVLLFIPIGLYFILTLIRKTPILKRKVSKKRHAAINIGLGIYSFIFINILLIALLRNVSNVVEIIFIVLLLPLEAYFILLALEKLPKFKKKIKEQEVIIEEVGEVGAVETAEAEAGEVVVDEKIKEKDRRAFLKLVVGAGAGVLLTGIINPQKASAAFFGSVPGPGTISIKDTTGTKIDPAIQEPLDGYSIANYVESGSYPHYYGFLNKGGAWYILQIVGDSDNTFLYASGTGAAGQVYNWAGRASLAYAAFNTTF